MLRSMPGPELFLFASTQSSLCCLVVLPCLDVQIVWIGICLCLSDKETVCCPVPCCVCLASLVSAWMVLGFGHSLQLGCTALHAALHFTALIFLCWPVVSLAVTGIPAPSVSAPASRLSNLLCVSLGLTEASVATCSDLCFAAHISDLFSSSNTLSYQLISYTYLKLVESITTALQ